MNSNKIKVACAALFAMTTIGTHAQTADSNSGSQSSSTATAVSLGGGSSISTNNNTNNNTTTSTSRGGNATSTSGVRGSGNSNVQVNVTMPSASSGGLNQPQGVNTLASAGAPGTSPYNTQTTENVNYSGTQTIKTNPAIQAPGLTTTLSDTCMGSVSVGVSFPGFGATGGTTLVDQACVRRLDAREFRAMGLTDVALALLCQSDANRRAVEATGHLCPGTTAPLARSNVAPSAEATVADDIKYRDPLVRSRLGLPPLDAAVPAAAATRPIATSAVQSAPLSMPMPAPAPAVAKAAQAAAAIPAAVAPAAAAVPSAAQSAASALPAAAVVAAPAVVEKAAPVAETKAPEPVPAATEKAAQAAAAPAVDTKAPEAAQAAADTTPAAAVVAAPA
ncbi:chemotaxis protein CheA, partial [Burkholderia multivorans]